MIPSGYGQGGWLEPLGWLDLDMGNVLRDGHGITSLVGALMWFVFDCFD